MLTSLKAMVATAKEDIATNGGAPVPLDVRTVAVMLVTCVLLTLFYYWGRPGFFQSQFDAPLSALLNLENSEYRGLLRYGYWAIASLVIRVAIPLAMIVWWFRESPRDYGFRLWEPGHGLIYALMYVVMLPVLIGASFFTSFQNKYPFYELAGDSVVQFVLFQSAYGIQFLSLEAFFRGFLIFALFKRFGYYSVVIMTIPYCMIHFAKPMPETLGAIVAGLLLGYLAIKSKSFLPGALLHFGVGFTMDLACIAQRAL
ncbi:MAG: CPBP family intramembrane metalloprotease [Bradymonadaceae bacterium]|nr:CPBP family intramembrane metalloprotease [Lujinxingiaceae bacterium]